MMALKSEGFACGIFDVCLLCNINYHTTSTQIGHQCACIYKMHSIYLGYVFDDMVMSLNTSCKASVKFSVLYEIPILEPNTGSFNRKNSWRI